MSHLEQRLQADLEEIRNWVWDLGEHVETAVRDAKRVLLLRDEVLAYKVVLGDHPINRASRECDRLCHAFIATHLPSAGHLREMASTIRVNVVLERIGDYATTMCREALQLKKPLPESFQLQLDQLADECIDILHQSRKAFREHNADAATTIMKAAKRVDSNMDAIYQNLFKSGGDLKKREMLVVFVVFNLLRRVADQAKNICDQTVFTDRGVAKIPKVHKILFLDQADHGLGFIAAAIGRKRYPESAQFSVASPGGGEPAPEIKAFMEETGMEPDGMKAERTEALVHDYSDYDVIVSVKGSVYDYLNKIPFHTSALRWTPAETDEGTEGESLTQSYRYLVGQITGLMELLVGKEAS